MSLSVESESALPCVGQPQVPDVVVATRPPWTSVGVYLCSKGCNGVEHEETPIAGVASCSKPVRTAKGASVVCCNQS